MSGLLIEDIFSLNGLLAMIGSPRRLILLCHLDFIA